MKQLSTKQKADIVYARTSAAIDFANEVAADRFRRGVIAIHSADWPWRKKTSDGNASSPATDHVQLVSHG
jgi:hypothetical protein